MRRRRSRRTLGYDLFRERRGSGHWGRYADPSEIFARYRVCLVCKRVTRNPAFRPLLHNGRKGRG